MALSYDPYMVAALQNLGNAYLRANNESAATAVYQKALQVEPENPDLHYNLAVTYAKLKEHRNRTGPGQCFGI